MTATSSPLVDRIAWMWHGHFVSSLDKVRVGRWMVDQVRLFRRSGLGDARTLLRAMTLDPAMLVYLDLRSSEAGDPNENFARELLELFTLGVGNYGEHDVAAGAVALTGWVLGRDGTVRFVPRRHRDSPQTYLGVGGVHDLDTVLDAVMAHRSFAPFMAETVAGELLGTHDVSAVAAIARAFTASGLDLGVLVRAALDAGLSGATAPMLSAPVPWLVTAARVTGAVPDPKKVARELRIAGQLPMLPPNVAGWPGGEAWLAAGSLVARTNLAAAVAATANEPEVLAAAGASDVQVLADALGLPSTGFSSDSTEALLAVPAGRDRLAIALVTPEFLIV